MKIWLSLLGQLGRCAEEPLSSSPKADITLLVVNLYSFSILPESALVHIRVRSFKRKLKIFLLSFCVLGRSGQFLSRLGWTKGRMLPRLPPLVQVNTSKCGGEIKRGGGEVT